jgi:hypothetical protein
MTRLDVVNLFASKTFMQELSTGGINWLIEG